MRAFNKGTDFRIAFIIACYPPVSGGAEAQAKRLAETLGSKGLHITVLTMAVPGLPALEVSDGVTVRRLWAPGKGVLAAVAFMISLGVLLLKNRTAFDVYHVHLASSHAIVAGFMGPLLNVPILLKFGATREFGDIGTSKRKFAGQWKLNFLKGRMDAFVCTSHEMMKEVASEGFERSRTHLIPNGVDTRIYCPLETHEREELRRNLSLGGHPTALFSGRLEPQKGLDVLLDAWKDVVGWQPGALLIMAGNGSLAPMLRDKAEQLGISSTIRFTGWLSPDELRRYYQAADLFVLPSHAEGMSNALLEAMACGLPVVASRVGGNEDVVVDGVNGYLVEPGKAAPLADAVARLLHDSGAASAMGLKGRELMESNYSMHPVTECYINLYHELSDSSGRLSRRG